MKEEDQNTQYETIDLKPGMLVDGAEIIVYGASVYGEIAYRLLENISIKPSCYCDRAARDETFLGIKVIRPEELIAHKDAWVLIASADYFHEIREALSAYGIKRICNMSYLLQNCEVDMATLSRRGQDIYRNKNNYIDVVHQRQADGNLNFTRLQYVVSERCTLRCRDCTHLMQYYRSPKNVDLGSYKEAFDRIVRISDNISEIRILGGEPFINPDMHKIIEWWQDSPKIGIFTIYTNGTLVPSEQCLAILKNGRCRVRISDYGHNSERIKKVAEVLAQNDIEYYINKCEAWADAGDLHKRNRIEADNVKLFADCYERECITFLHGKLHRCPRSAHAMNLGAMPDIPEDYVDVAGWEGTDEELVKRIRKLQSKKVITACDYCDGPSTKRFDIPPAIQVKQPLDFIQMLPTKGLQNESK